MGTSNLPGANPTLEFAPTLHLSPFPKKKPSQTKRKSRSAKTVQGRVVAGSLLSEPISAAPKSMHSAKLPGLYTSFQNVPAVSDSQRAVVLQLANEECAQG